MADLQGQARHLGLVWRKRGCTLEGPEHMSDGVSAVFQEDGV